MDDDVKMNVLQRIIAGKQGLDIYDVKIKGFLEEKDGVCVWYKTNESECFIETLITWWTIAFS